MLKNHYDVLVIGGGASGLMAATIAAKNNQSVCILEKNQLLGQKLSISGGGRCNIMNAETDTHTFLNNYGDAAKFLYSAFATFGLADTKSFFEDNGLPLIEQARQRIFPVSEEASDVVAFFQALLHKHTVTVKTNEPVTNINLTDNTISNVTTSKQTYTAKKYILATGGLSHPETGSTGDGFTWLSALGHTVQRPNPALVPLISPDRWVHNLAGTSLEHARITFSNSSGKVWQTGRILFTHFGLSGPTILNSAAEVTALLQTGAVQAHIDLFPGIDDAVLKDNVQNAFIEYSNKTFQNVVRQLVPAGLASAVCSFIPEDLAQKKAHSVTRSERIELINVIRALPLSITGTKGDDWSIVSDGGVDLTEVDTRTFQSKRISNLYITGDLLHINRPSGGFSLQLCWTTGAVAGMSVS